MAAWGRRICLACAIVVVVLAAFVLAQHVLRSDRFTLQNTTNVTSTVDGMSYRVHPQHADPLAAADRLAMTNRHLLALMRHLKEKYGANAPDMRARYPDRAHALDALLSRYNPDNLVENSPLDPGGDTSYTLDKGALMALCLRERDPKYLKCLRGGCPGVDPAAMKLHDDNVTTFVAVHELAHVAINDVDHPPRFWRAFKFLLQEALDAGVLPNLRFDQYPVMYCGMRVAYSPLNDSSVVPL